MTSEEALERIETVFIYNKQRKKSCYAHFLSESKVVEEYYKDYNTIKQDLEFLEWLKEDNKKQVELVGKLVNKNNQLEKENTNLHNNFDLYEKGHKQLEIICENFEKENQELKEENQNLKKIIEILKERLYKGC